MTDPAARTWRIAPESSGFNHMAFRALEFHDESNADGQEWWHQAWLPTFIADIIEADFAALESQHRVAEQELADWRLRATNQLAETVAAEQELADAKRDLVTLLGDNPVQNMADLEQEVARLQTALERAITEPPPSFEVWMQQVREALDPAQEPEKT